MEPAGWLSDDEYARIRAAVPIPCVDVLVWRAGADGREAGLITREDGAGGQGYAMIGGRVRRGETLHCALERHVGDALGPDVRLGAVDAARPLGAFEYFPDGRDGLVDPRKHAIALTYVAELDGDPAPRGEARAFRWFALGSVPPPDEFAFGHGIVVHRLLGELAAGS